MQRLAKPQTIARMLPRLAPARLSGATIRSFSAVTDVHPTQQPPVRDIDIYAPPPARQEQSFMQKYGWYPLTALMGTIIVSKEMVRVNEDLFLVINAGLVVLAFYVGLGDSLRAGVATAKLDDEKYYRDAIDFELALVEEVIRINDAAIAKPGILENYLKQYESASSHYEHAQKLLVQLALRNSVEAKLLSVKEREGRKEREQKDLIIKNARSWLLNKFQSSPQLRQAAVESALQNIGQSRSVVPDDQDPIKQLFRDYIAEAKRTIK